MLVFSAFYLGPKPKNKNCSRKSLPTQTGGHSNKLMVPSGPSPFTCLPDKSLDLCLPSRETFTAKLHKTFLSGMLRDKAAPLPMHPLPSSGKEEKLCILSICTTSRIRDHRDPILRTTGDHQTAQHTYTKQEQQTQNAQNQKLIHDSWSVL